MKVDIHSIHFDADQKLLEFIEEKTSKLAQFDDNIISAEVFLRIEKADSNENKLVEIKLNVPGKDLFAKKHSKSFEEATDEVVEALRRQVLKNKGKAKVV
jgi:putative sigma-54 modulation protein